MRDYAALATRIKLLAHPERLRILEVLRRRPECVCHLEVVLDRPQPYVSQQLRVLRDAGIIADEKDGLNVFYRLIDDDVTKWLDAILGPVVEGRSYRQDGALSCSCPRCDADEPSSVAV